MNTIYLSPIKNTLYPFSPLSKTLKPKSRNTPHNNMIPSALRRSNSYGSQSEGRLVDENMIILRKRIHEMKMVERNYEPPKEWMEWEKQLYAQWDEYVCTVLGVVQSQLMNTRPSVALGVTALFTLSVPTSLVLLAINFVQAADKIIHL